MQYAMHVVGGIPHEYDCNSEPSDQFTCCTVLKELGMLHEIVFTE